MISRIQHIALIISSEENLRFYEQLGFRECFRKVREYDTVVLMVGNGIELEIFIDPRHASNNRDASDETCGLRHFALQVCPGTMLEDEMESLRQQSSGLIKFGRIMEDWTGVRFVFTKDPDGTVVELRE